MDLGMKNGILTLSATAVDDVIINVSGTGIPVIHNYPTFQDQRIAFGGGYNQTETATFNLHNDLTNIETIKMYIKLRCPSGGCNAWDVFANIKVKDISSGDWYEIGRYITPYGIDNSAVVRGFEVDVTDFKSLLSGSVELFARIETWGSDGWELSVDFDYIEGTPDYPYYAVADVISYDDWSTSGVPYGVTNDPMVWDLNKLITIPANAEATSLRTIISGWGHATPTDSDGRPCAEWCYRTHDVKINGANTFQHYMGPIGCGSNPVSGQGGNWSPDRAGWCPGMAVPVRVDELATAMAGNTITFEYDYENWVTDGGNTSGNSGAYYATSTFVIVKSNTPIAKPTVN
ncbi:MAG: peptidase [Kordia sp.]|nr:MAG: peptidase [Kordia sp.]